MNYITFEQLVTEALASLPEEFKQKLDNIDIVIVKEPTTEQLVKLKLRRDTSLFGLYEGIPLTKRTSNYTLVLPDKITIFQRPIEEYSETEEGIKLQVKKTVLHELGHHFGMSDEELRRIKY